MTAPLPAWAAAIEGAKLYFRNTVFQRRSALILVLVGIDLLIAFIWSLQSQGPELSAEEGFLRITRQAMFGFLVPFVALYFGTATIRDEYEGGTLPYLLTRPISRTVLLSGRLMAAILTVFTILAVTQAINIWILGQGVSNHRLGAIFFALFLASVAYSSVFATLGAALSRPFLFGVIYLLLVEFTLMQVPVSARFATLGAHVANVAGFTVEPSQIGFDAYNLAASTSLGVICGVTMLVYVIAVIVFNRRQYLN